MTLRLREGTYSNADWQYSVFVMRVRFEGPPPARIETSRFDGTPGLDGIVGHPPLLPAVVQPALLGVVFGRHGGHVGRASKRTKTEC